MFAWLGIKCNIQDVYVICSCKPHVGQQRSGHICWDHNMMVLKIMAWAIVCLQHSSCHYVTSWWSLMPRKGGNYIRRAWPNLWAVVTVVWVFWYKAFGLVSKPQTLYLGCLGAVQGGSITRMNFATYLSICMHPDFSWGFLVSTTSVVE